jgi:hypothetical protein
MPLHKIEKATNRLTRLESTAFATERWHERRDLQPLLRDNPAAIDSDLFIIAEEYGSWEGSARRIDLLGLDGDANLVVVELKRAEEGGHMELQALRYAAMLSAMNFGTVVRAHEEFLSRQGQDPAVARQNILTFLGTTTDEDASISNTPRVILVAPSFSREITTTVIWLNDQGLDIRCFQANLYRLGEELYLDIAQIIPLPSVADYQVRLREKNVRAERRASVSRRQRTVNILATHGVLTSGTRLYLLQTPRPGLEIPDEAAKWATYVRGGAQGFRWDFDEQMYSLSDLCRTVCERFGGEVGSGAFPGPDYWAIEGETVSLSERARTLEAEAAAEMGLE